MKRWFIHLLLAVLIISSSYSIGAAAYEKNHGGHGKFYVEKKKQKEHKEQNNQARKDAEYIIHRTATVIYEAQRVAKHGYRYAGLARAVAHYRHNLPLFDLGKTPGAVFHGSPPTLPAPDSELATNERLLPGKDHSKTTPGLFVDARPLVPNRNSGIPVSPPSEPHILPLPYDELCTQHPSAPDYYILYAPYVPHRLYHVPREICHERRRYRTNRR